MKRSKWTKWQVGAGSALIVALLFSQVKSSDAYKALSKQVAEPADSAVSMQEQEQSIGDDEDVPRFDGEQFSDNRSFREGGRSHHDRGEWGSAGGYDSSDGNDSGQLGSADRGSSSQSGSHATSGRS